MKKVFSLSLVLILMLNLLLVSNYNFTYADDNFTNNINKEHYIDHISYNKNIDDIKINREREH